MAYEQVITRFAPSPTGHLHVGGARTALFCWALAEKARRTGADGRFILRIEDTDQKRSSDDAAKGILEDLAWMGIEWHEGPEFAGCGGDPRGVGPFHQSQRLDLYAEYIEQLIQEGKAYPAFDTPEELNAKRTAAREAKRSFRYKRNEGADHAKDIERMKTEPHVIRFAMPTDPVEVKDSLLGDIEFTDEHTDDFVIRKQDGFPTYHFAVVVDDELMGVTHVVRGQEHLQNTPKHVALQQALGFRIPVYAHVPSVFNPDGSKMSKRDKDKAGRQACKDAGLTESPVSSIDADRFANWLKDKKSQLETEQLRELAAELDLSLPEIDVEDFRRSGYIPEVLCNYLALLGWNPGMKNDDGTDLERFDNTFLAEHFSFARAGKSPSKFDRDKLVAFSQQTLNAMPAEQFESAWRAWLLRERPDLLKQIADRLPLLARAAQPRARTLSDAIEPVAFVLLADAAIEYDEKAVNKALKKGDPSGIEQLRAFAPEVDAIDPFEPEQIDAAVRAFCESRELGMGKIAQPLRVAITGGTVSPGLGDTLAAVGKASAKARIDRCLAQFG
ncbi:MAG: glutamate--tRNA ligase [Planctomycetota bacterium]